MAELNLNTVSKRWKDIQSNKILGMEHDVAFLLGEARQRTTCHRFVLSAISPVFQAMFSEKFEDCPEIEIPDVEHSVFENIIKYAYAETINIAVEDALSTFYASDKYDISELRNFSSDLLQKNILVDNAVDVYQLGILMCEAKLMEKAMEIILCNFSEIIKSEKLESFSPETLNIFFGMDEIGMVPEIELFDIAVRWAKYVCQQRELIASPENLREILRDVMKNIRFPNISATEFTAQIEPSGILSKDECYNIYKYFSLSEKDRLLVNCGEYNSKQRKKLLVMMLWDKDVELLKVSPIIRMREDRENLRRMIAMNNGRMNFNPAFPMKRVLVYQERFQITSTNNSLDSIFLRGIGFVAPIATEKENVKINVRLTNFPLGFSISMPVEEVTAELAPTSAEVSFVVFENPVKLRSLAKKIYTLDFTFKYMEGKPTILGDYPPISKTTEGPLPQTVSVRHTFGHRIIAAMQFILE